MFYVLAVSLSSLSASDWLFSAKPPADSQRRPDYERNPKTAPNGHRFSTAGWFPHGHGRGDISLGSHTHTQVSPLGPELYPPNLARSLTSLCRLPQSVWTPSISPSPPSHHRDPPPSLSPLLAVWGNLEFSSEVHLLLDFYF